MFRSRYRIFKHNIVACVTANHTVRSFYPAF